MRNDGASSSRNRRDMDEWRPENDRYDQSSSKDRYRRGGGDDYGGRDTDSYGRDYPSNRQYSDSHDDDRGPQSSHHDGMGRSPPVYDDRDIGYSRWTPKDNRHNHRNDRGRGYDFNDRYKDSGRRDEFKERQRDNGWASRRRINAEAPSSQAHAGKSEHQISDDRPGEPNPLGHTMNSRHENQKKNKHNKKKNKTKNEKRNRDWRNDDSHLNK
jgi:hypothetical protein